MIEPWLEQFHNAWKAHDIDTVMNLFADDVEYWETPRTLLRGKGAIRSEWQAIAEQQGIRVSWEVYSSADNRHTVIWKLHYKGIDGTHDSSGVYLITLDDTGLCNYFYYVGQE